ncbi:beta/gamma crystallin domain-containing protein 1 isoform X2 [Hemicordylus capensis]|uniref:beta/gamma crystallin domain-containing protein 1 isoform X2 n=1 Tax=Hemicordylus capensis TaxID=884348 RepID=UPI00230206F1|nr:beta/gamma crystallin domain-containing protein 1 isoform X2 [Hemicordylus capensis]
MEKGGFRRLGRLFHHKSDSEPDSEPDTSRETPLSSPCPSPSLQGKREHRRSRSPPGADSGERKKRSAFGHWRLKKKHKDPPAAALETSSSYGGSAPASPSLSFSSYFSPSETSSARSSYFDMPDTQYVAQENQLPPPVPLQETQFAFAIPMVEISTSTLPASFRKSKTHSSESKEENKKKAVLGKFGNFFTTGRRKNPKNTLGASLRPTVIGETSGSVKKGIAPLASIDFDDLKDLSKSEESLIDKICDQSQSRIQYPVEEAEDFIYKRDLTPLYNNIVSEWNTKGVSSDSECSTDSHSSSETIKNTLFDSNLTLQTVEPEKDLVTDTIKTTTPDFFKSLTNIPSEDLEHSLLNHKQLVNAHTFVESEYAASKDQPAILESKPSERVHPSKVLTLDIFLRRTEQHLNEPVTILDDDCSSDDTMDKKSAVRRSGKRRKSQSSGDMPNGDRNVTENTTKEEPVFDSTPADLVSEKANDSERKIKSSQQINSPTAHHDIRAGSNHRGLSKTELEKSKQQLPTSSPYRKKSVKKNPSDAGPLSPTGLKGHGKDSSVKRQTEGAIDGNLTRKCASVEKLFSGESIIETSRVTSMGNRGNSTSPLSEGSTDSKASHPVNNSDGSVLLHTDKHKNGEMGTPNGKQTSSDWDSTRQRNTCFDVPRTVTTKVSLPAKPKNIELNLKASQTLEDAENEQNSMDKTVKINFSIANKISMFENKQSTQNQSADVSSSKKGSISNTFVGRAKLKFGKQTIESEQTNRITNKSNSRQKPLQNGTKIKEASSSNIKMKSEGGVQAGISANEEFGKAARSRLNQNGNIEDNQVSVPVSKKIDADLAEDNLLPKTASLPQNEEIETSQNDINRSINARSTYPESVEELSLNTEIYPPSKDDNCLLQSDLVPRESDLEHSTASRFEIEDKNANTVFENIQMFEQHMSEQQNPSNGSNVLKAGHDNICDSPSDMDKFTETLKNLDSSVCIPQKKKRPKVPKTPAPHFAMPPIHEDNLEKILDPKIFTLGLGIKRDKPQDLAPSLQLRLQSLETDARVRPKRASAENSILLQSLKASNRGDSILQEMSGKESKDNTDGDVKRSRLENSAIFSSLLLPATKEKVFTPSVTSVNTITTSFASQKSPDSLEVPPLRFGIAQKSESLSGFMAPNYMEKYLQTDDAKKERSLQLPNFGNSDTSFSSWLKSGQYEPNVSLGFLDTEVFSGNNQNKINPRPGKLMICSKSDPSENTVEVFHDELDCTSWILPPVILVKVIRGCWILYEKPHFEGPSIPLEEGELELTNLWGEEPSDNQDECRPPEPAVIGSIRHVVKDYRICQIDLFTEPEGLGAVNQYFDDIEEIRIIGKSQKTCSIQVHWGMWLIYEEPGFQGIPLMLEPGIYPNLSFWEKKEAYIRSMRPLKMGGRKVECPESPKVIVYEKPFFDGNHIELDSELVALAEEEDKKEESAELETRPLASIGSIKVTGGVWIAYEKPGFAGHQYLLEEGEYQEWMDWGGYDEQVQSLQPVLGSFTQPHMIMYAEKDFGIKSPNINVLGIISNLKDTGYGLRTQSINVLSGVWVAYENPDFTGEQYILNKGMYPNYEAWGGRNCKISSVQPIVLVQLFSEPEFLGSSQIFEKDTSQIFPAKSSKVLSGSWIAYDKEDFSGNQYVLEEGAYPDLSAMGCLPQTCLKSLQVVNIELSEPVITLFEKENFQGKKMEFTTEIVNLSFLGYNPHAASVQVHGGIWVIYEHNNYRGRQILLSPRKIPNWYEISGYHRIGSLRPLLQKRVYFRLQNKETGKFMSTDGNLDDLNLLRIQVVEDSKSDEQVWVYQDGFIKSKVAEDFCLTIVGNLITPGAKLGLALEQNEEKQFWTIKPDGRIYSKMKPNLVLDIKGGTHYDQNHLIVSSVSEDKPTQCWEPMVM